MGDTSIDLSQHYTKEEIDGTVVFEKDTRANSIRQKWTETNTGGAQACTIGQYTVASGDNSFAEGSCTKAKNMSEHSGGNYNISNKTTSAFGSSGNTTFLYGIGTSDSVRKNAIEIMENGEIYIIGVGGYNGTNPTSMVDSLQKVLEELGITIDWNIL